MKLSPLYSSLKGLSTHVKEKQLNIDEKSQLVPFHVAGHNYRTYMYFRTWGHCSSSLQ